MLAGYRPDTTPVGEWCDASWAVLAEFMGPGEHMVNVWSEVTGETVDVADTAEEGPGREPSPSKPQDRSVATQVANLSEDELAAWVPAYSNPNISDDDFVKGWRVTSKFAAGQAGALRLGGNATKRGNTRPHGAGD